MFCIDHRDPIVETVNAGATAARRFARIFAVTLAIAGGMGVVAALVLFVQEISPAR